MQQADCVSNHYILKLNVAYDQVFILFLSFCNNDLSLYVMTVLDPLLGKHSDRYARFSNSCCSLPKIKGVVSLARSVSLASRTRDTLS
jgi:hypothetical protein